MISCKNSRTRKKPIWLISSFVWLRNLPPPAPTEQEDPVFELIGAYHSEQPLIDDIPVSEDPDLYLTAEAMGGQANEMHAWEIAPTRYGRSSENDVDEADG